MLAEHGAGQNGYVLPTQEATWGVKSRCFPTYSWVPERTGLEWQPYHSLDPGLEQPFSIVFLQSNDLQMDLWSNRCLEYCEHQWEPFLRVMFQIQMCCLERPFQGNWEECFSCFPWPTSLFWAWDWVAVCSCSAQAPDIKKSLTKAWGHVLSKNSVFCSNSQVHIWKSHRVNIMNKHW